MARLPQPGGDRNAWGHVANEYLSVSHNPDGTIKPSAVQFAVTEEVESALGTQLQPAVEDAMGSSTTLAAAVDTAIDAEPRITQLVADNILARGRVFDIKAYGATGDGITDDTAAIQAAVDAMPGTHGARGGGTLVFPNGVYRVSETILIDKPGVTVRGAGPFTSLFAPTPALTGPVFRFKDTTYVMRGPVIENLVITMYAGVDCGGIEVMGAYDQAILRNIFIGNLRGNNTGIAIIPNPDSPTKVGQTLLAENCWVNGEQPAFSGRCWNIEHLQEAVFIGCKGIGGGEGTEGTHGTAFRISGCKGIAFYGCSAGLATNGWQITPSSTRASDTITIDTPTIEGVHYPIYAISGGGALTNTNISFRSPRKLSALGVLPGGTGPIYLDGVTVADIETRNIPLTILAGSSYVKANVFDVANVIDNGHRSVIIEQPNGINAGAYTIRATGGLRVNSGSDPLMRVIPTTTTTHVPLQLRAWTGTSWSLYQVEVGPANSGGTGYRALRINN